MEKNMSLKRWSVLVVIIGLLAASVSAQDVVTTLDGEVRFELPEGWSVVEEEGYAVVNAPNEEIITVISVEDTEDMVESINLLWAKYDPDFDTSSSLQQIDVPEEQLYNGFETGIAVVYANGTGADGALVVGGSYIYEGRTYPQIVITTVAAYQRRLSQLTVFGETFAPTAFEDEVEETATVAAWNDEFADNIDAFAADAMEQLNVAGAAMAVVQDGEIVYAKGFGQANENGDMVEADTNFLIASMTKSMTTLAMAQAVDAGLFTWETPVIEVLPTFAVADDAITQTITMQDLVCACSGVPRRDLEILLNEVTAVDVLDSLQTFEFFTEFGAAFQYSNQLVATAGFVTAFANGASEDELLPAYEALLQEGIFQPLGMERSTVLLDEMEAKGNFASPYTTDVTGNVAFDVQAENWLEPIAPSGGVWSNVNDIAQYLLMELGKGEGANGIRIVSAENLERTWQPQIDINSSLQYGLGWFVTDFGGYTVITHGGNALGYTSEMAFLPDAGIGVVVLTNQGYSAFPQLLQQRVIALLLGQEDETTEGLTEVVEAAQKQIDTIETRFNADIDEVALGEFASEWTNAALGDMTVSVEGEEVFVDFGEYRTRLWQFLTSSTEPEATPEPLPEPQYVGIDAPLANAVVLRFRDDTIILGGGAAEYTFTRK
jgi:CubicO group peptidase (beta-lactamase class C family)